MHELILIIDGGSISTIWNLLISRPLNNNYRIAIYDDVDVQIYKNAVKDSIFMLYQFDAIEYCESHELSKIYSVMTSPIFFSVFYKHFSIAEVKKIISTITLNQVALLDDDNGAITTLEEFEFDTW